MRDIETLAANGGEGADSGPPVDSITFLRRHDRAHLGKRYRVVNGAVQREDAPDAKRFRFREVAASSLADVAAAIEEAGAEGEIAIRGEPLPETPRNQLVLRRSRAKAGEPATFREVPRRWLMVDIDRGLDVGPDWHLDPETAVWLALAELPEAFRGASCHWALSSGACMPAHGSRPATASATVKLHLTFWLSRPVGSAEAKAWLHGHPADPALYNPVQPHYIAAPEFRDGLVDPVPRRSGIWQGRAPVVTVPDDLGAIVRDHAARGLGSAASANLDADDLDSLVASARNLIIEDGSAVRHYILSAGGKFAWRHGRDADPQQQADNEAALVEALSALAGEFRGAREVETYDIPRIVAEAYASAPKRTPIPESVAAFADKLTGRAEDVPELPPLVELSRDDAEVRLREAIGGVFTRALIGDPDKPLQVAIKGAAGLGKTSIVKDEINARPGIRVGAYTSTVRLGEHWTAGLADPALIRGRSQEVDGKPLCAKYEEAVVVASAGFNVASTLCKRGSGPDTEHCEFFRTCRYLKQLAARATVRVHAHEYAWLPPPPASLVGKIPKPDLIVIDEGFALAAARKVDIPLDRLTADNPFLAAAEGNPTGSLGRRLRDALEAGRDLRDEFTAEEVDAAVAAAAAALSRPAPVTPGMKQAEQRRLLKGLGRSLATRLYRLWTVLAEELASGRKVQRVRLLRNVPQPGGAEPRDVVRVHWRRPLKLPAGVPVLLLDASLDPDIARLWFPHLEVIEIPAHRSVTVIQVASTACSKNRLLSYDGANDAAKATAANRLADVKAMAMAEARKGRKVALALYKQARERMGEVPGVDMLHFGAVRGLDHLKHHDVMFVGGRNQPPPAEVEDIALSLFGDRHELNLTGAYVTRPRAYRMRDGSRPVVGVAEHDDPLVSRVLWQVREEESLQVLDRLRLIHRTKPATVYLLSNLPLPALHVDRLVTWGDLVPDRWQQTADRLGGCLPLSPSELARLAPEIWGSRDAARKWVETARKVRGFPMDNSLWKNSHLSAAEYRTLGQRGSAHVVMLPGAVVTCAAAEAMLRAAGFGDDIRVLAVADLRPADPAPVEATVAATTPPPPEPRPMPVAAPARARRPLVNVMPLAAPEPELRPAAPPATVVLRSPWLVEAASTDDPVSAWLVAGHRGVRAWMRAKGPAGATVVMMSSLGPPPPHWPADLPLEEAVWRRLPMPARATVH